MVYFLGIMMNEQIKELSIKAGFPEWSNHAIEFELEQFAELIILECDRYARSTWEHGHLLGGDLKRLFGFEE